MLKIRNCLAIIEGQRGASPALFAQLRYQTNAATAKEATKTTRDDAEWQQARPFEEIPYTGKLSLAYNMSFPGGKYKNKDLSQLVQSMHDDYGDILRMPTIMGSTAMVATYQARSQT